MEHMHINDRGAHTTVIEGAWDILKQLRKIGAEISPGIIEGNVGAHGRSMKLKRLSNATFEMTVVVNGSKQTFKVYGKDQVGIAEIAQRMKSEGWHIPDMMDLSSDRDAPV